MGLFTWLAKTNSQPDARSLGGASMALALADTRDSIIPSSCIGVCIGVHGQTTRVAAGARMLLAAGERGYWVHPGPYICEILPFAATAEIGLRLRLVLDFADPRVAHQRFDLFLSSEGEEGEGDLTLARCCALLQCALQDALARGDLDLPPCATLDEWQGFRAGLNQLIYIRFGLTVEECLITDFGDRIDYAAIVDARAQVAETPPERADSTPVSASPATSGTADAAKPAPAKPTPPPAPMPADIGGHDAKVLRRLFLELPRLTSGFRLLPLPAGLPLFQSHRALLQRLDLAALAAGTMPALAWASPDQTLPADQQARRWHNMLSAEQELDAAWALLARLTLCDAEQFAARFEDAERIMTNIDTHLAQRRAPYWADLADPADPADPADSALPTSIGSNPR